MPILLTASADTGGSMSGILSTATQVLQWFITSMGTVLGFVINNPVVLILFMIFLVGAAVGMLMRLWKSV